MEKQIIHNPTVPAGPLLPSNDPAPNGPFQGRNPMADYYGGRDPFADASHAAEDPTVMAQVQTALEQSVQHVEMPDFPSDIVRLPIPVTIGDRTYHEARVRELTGADEEELGRAAASGEPERILDTLLTCGLVAIGDHTPNAGDIGDLAIPNRDALILGIRKVTYGEELKFERLACTECEQLMQVTYDLNEVPHGPELATGVTALTVSLRRGGHVVVRFPNGSDQNAVLGEIRDKSITRAEQDSLLLSRVLVEKTDASGQKVSIEDPLAVVRALSIPDRTAILTALDERPGPRMYEATITCPYCEQETEVPLSVDVLFRG